MKKTVVHPPEQISADDAALFRVAVGEVKPLAAQHRVKPYLPARKAILRTSTLAPTIPDNLSDFTTGDVPSEFLRNGLSRMALRKLRRGMWPIQDTLDLHGNNSDTARKLLQEFLHGAAQQKMRCVLVIHGKGINSKGGEAVLRKLTRHWLMQHPLVLGYCDAPPNQGGSGAVLVLLRNNA